jgi:Reverse transcriptase (RNA-dependent DNA polymerase)
LIAFDLKGAFNGVKATTLDARLREKGIPTPARKWIQSFIRDQMASIYFDGFSIEVGLLENAGLAQGSPLSPILFTLINSDLVDQEVDSQGGASIYIDDYFR